MYAYICKTCSGFFAEVCAAGYRPPFSCDPPPTLNERTGAPMKGLRSVKYVC